MSRHPLFHVYTLIASIFVLGCGSRDDQTPPTVENAASLRLAEILRQASALEEVDFPTIIEASTGHRVLPLEPGPSATLVEFAVVFDRVVEEMNSPDSPVRNLRRINEASRYFEDALRVQFDQLADFACDFPLNKKGDPQRTGYPDLRLVHLPTSSVFYLDPKLYEAGSESSSLRTFYYTPGSANTKVLEDAHHLLVGFAHDGNDGHWRFLRWRLVDLSRLTVRLKTEIQASNRDLYEDDNVIREGSLGSGNPQRRD